MLNLPGLLSREEYLIPGSCFHDSSTERDSDGRCAAGSLFAHDSSTSDDSFQLIRR